METNTKKRGHRWTAEEAREMSRKAQQARRSKKFREALEKSHGNIQPKTIISKGEVWIAQPDMEVIVRTANRRSFIRLIILSILTGVALGYTLVIYF